MRKDYHMHPNILRKPEQFNLFIENALKRNIKEICITDHMPLSISNASDRIPHGKVYEYCQAVREMAKKYEHAITIKCGIEIDYHPSAISEVERVLEEGDFDFILASSHMHIFIKDYQNYTFNDFSSAAIENSIKAAETGWFNAISHLDMYRFAFENRERFPLVEDEYNILNHKFLIDNLFDAMNKRGVLLEINPHLAESKQSIEFTYPEKTIVEWALEKGLRFSYGSDAHKPNSVGAYLDELENDLVYGKAISTWEKDK